MERLEIEPTKMLPKIVLDKEKGIFSFSGTSRPENPTQFFIPVFKWLNEYLKDPNPQTKFDFNIEYFNSSTSKILLDLLEVLSEAASKGNNVQVYWYYKAGDREMQEAGEELLELAEVPYNLVELN